MTKQELTNPKQGPKMTYGGARKYTRAFVKHMHAALEEYRTHRVVAVTDLRFLHQYAQRYGDWMMRVEYSKPRPIAIEWLCVTNAEDHESRINIVMDGKRLLTIYRLKPNTDTSKRDRYELMATHFSLVR